MTAVAERTREWIGPIVAVVAIALASWPYTSVMATSGLDGSWVIGLNLAAHEGFNYGSDVVFTYGPLGFLRSLVAVYPWPLRLSFAWLTAMQLALAAALLWPLRAGLRTYWLAVPCALAIAIVARYEASVIAGFIAAVALIAGRSGGLRATTLLAAALGVLTGLELLGKINAGVTLAVLAVIAAATASRHRRRIALTLAGAAFVSGSLAWLLTGQSLGAIPGYVSGALAISSGYANAMHLLWDGAGWTYWVAALIGLLGALVAFLSGRELELRARVGLLVAWAALFFLAFKTGFVRHGPGHLSIFASTTLGGLTAFAWAAVRRRAALAVGLVPLVLYVALDTIPLGTLVRADQRAGDYAHALAVVSDGSRTNDEIGRARAAIVQQMALGPQVLGALEGQTVAVEPWEISVPFAYRLNWQPLPVIQGYAAYTSSLDEHNADALAGADAPARILRQGGVSLDARNPAWDPPAAMRALLCHYRPLAAEGPWQVLGRTASRCGAPRTLSAVSARLGDAVPVPTANADELVYVEIDGFGLGAAEKLRTMLFRSVTRNAVLDGERRYRVLPETVGDGLLLRVPPAADFGPDPFALDQHPRTLTLERGTAAEQPDARVELRFVAVPIVP